MSVKSKQLKALYRGGQVRRFHVHPTVRQQNVAEHTYGVVALVYVLADMRPSPELVLAALLHDTPEQVTGDVPSPTKREMRMNWDYIEKQIMDRFGLPTVVLSEEDKRLLKLADIMDGMLFAGREAALGNTALREVYDVYREYAEQLSPTAEEAGMLDAVREITGLVHS